MEKIRSFLAIEIDEKLCPKMEELQKKLREVQADVKWVSPKNVHLTLKFFGSITQEELEKAAQIIHPIASQRKPFLISISGLGCFPSRNRPRVIWLGINDGAKEVSLLQKEIEKRLLDAGFPAEERPFTPHLTMGRVRSGRGLSQLIHLIGVNEKFEIGMFGVDEIILFKSDLLPSGAVYTRLRTFQLQGDGQT